MVALFATGYGQTSPPGVTGKAAQAPYGMPLGMVSVFLDGLPADVLYAAEAPGFVGLLQVNARIPGQAGKPRSVSAILRVGDHVSLSGITIWVF